MKVAVSSTGENLDSQIDPRFGRCACFVIVDTDDMSFQAYNNENMSLSGGAGIQSATFIIAQGVIAVLTGNCGPNAMKTFNAGNIDVITGQTGTVREAVERYKSGLLQPSKEATVEEKFGTGARAMDNYAQTRGVGRCMGGSGRGLGMGGGRGMGKGRGMGMGGGRSMGAQSIETIPADLEKEDLADLKKQAASLKKQMEEIQKKIEKLKES